MLVNASACRIIRMGEGIDASIVSMEERMDVSIVSMKRKNDRTNALPHFLLVSK